MPINEHGKFEKVWFEAPFCGFQHDMAFTDTWVSRYINRPRDYMLTPSRFCSQLYQWYDHFMNPVEPCRSVHQLQEKTCYG